MQHHGLGHLPQPDNFTTCGRLGIEINQVQDIEIFLHELADIFTSQYNNPVECYADDTIEEMRDEKIILDHPEIAEKILKGNAQVIFLKIIYINCTSIYKYVDNLNTIYQDYNAINSGQKAKEQVNPLAAQKMKANNYDPRRSAVLMAINAQ